MLDSLLLKALPQSSTTDGRWVYFTESGNIQSIEAPEVRNVLQSYKFYSVSLTNFLGYHRNQSSCLILFDTALRKIQLVQPMWYSEMDEGFLKLFIGKKFGDSITIVRFASDLIKLMMLGSTGQMENVAYSSYKVTFDMTYQGTKVKEVWRHLAIHLDNNAIVAFSSTNPTMNTTVVVK